MDKKVKLICVLCCLLVVGFPSMYLFGNVAGQSGSTFTIDPRGGYSGAPTYTAVTSGSTHYMKDASGALLFGSTSWSSVLSVAVNAIYDVGGAIYFPSGVYEFDSGVLYPRGTHSVKLYGDSGWGKSGTLSGMPIAGTILKFTANSGDFFSNTDTYNTWDGVGFQFENIQFIGVGAGTGSNTAVDCFHFTNLDQLVVSDCCFFGFGIAINCDFNGVDTAPMPGMGDIHDNLFSEIGLCAIKFDRFMQSKIHSNEFEAWGDYVSQIQLIDTNTVNVNDNRFAVPMDRTPSMTEVILVKTTSNIYCNQILICDNIVGMGDGTVKFPFIRMTHTGGSLPAVNIKSLGNELQFDYVLGGTDSWYVLADDMSKGSLVAHDYANVLCDKSGNLVDMTSGFTQNVFYQNPFAQLTLYVNAANIPTAGTITVYLGKNATTSLPVASFANLAVADCTWSYNFVVPSTWWYKVTVTGEGASVSGLYGVYS